MTSNLRALLMLTTAALLIGTPTAQAQQSSSAADAARRIDRIERELRAVQRRVFPGSETGLFEPEVTPGQPVTTPGGTVQSPGADVSARIDAIEAQLARLTGEVEQTGFRQREISAEIARLRTEVDGRLDRLEGTSATGTDVPTTMTIVTPTPSPAASTAGPRPTVTPSPTALPTPSPAPRPTPTPAPTATATDPAALAARRARVAAIAVPSTGDAPEDAYIYGYRLWEARLFSEAVLQLQKVIDDHPTHRRASFAGNLLGRSLLDNNQPSIAVRAFYDNYRNRPRGERAAESVYYMGMALIRLERNSDACRTFDEFDRSYGSSAPAALKAQVTTARAQARC